MKVTLRDLGFLEGLIDGEGSIGLRKTKRVYARRGFVWAPILSIANTDKALLEKAQHLLGGSLQKEDRERDPNKRQCYRLVVASNGMRSMLSRLRLVTKETQRLLALEALAVLHQGHRATPETDAMLERIWVLMRKLNRKGRR